MIKSVLILDEFFAMTAKIQTLFLSHIKITNYLTLKHGTFNLRQKNMMNALLYIASFVDAKGKTGLLDDLKRNYEEAKGKRGLR